MGNTPPWFFPTVAPPLNCPSLATDGTQVCDNALRYFSLIPFPQLSSVCLKSCALPKCTHLPEASLFQLQTKLSLAPLTQASRRLPLLVPAGQPGLTSPTTASSLLQKPSTVTMVDRIKYAVARTLCDLAEIYHRRGSYSLGGGK